VAVTTRRSTARKEPLTLSLVDVEPDMLDLAGGKAVNLGILLRAGFRVPPGTCVTTAAYTRVVGDLLQPVVEEMAKVAPGSPELDQLAAEARELVLTAPVPRDIVDAVRMTVSGPVAVRSASWTPTPPAAAPPTSWTRSAAAGRRCGPAGRCPTGPRTGSTRRRSGWPW
jgi:pyruvate,water dikinase